jgi:hypothetical protein
MPDPVTITCPAHSALLVPDLLDLPGTFGCPEPDCGTSIRITFPDDLGGGLTFLEQGAAQRHEFVLAHQAAGFSRSEAMQALGFIITATIMKGSGDA